MNTLAETIKELRHMHQLTQEDLASLCQVSHVSISKWETGKTMPDITLLPILARIFEVSIDELLNFKKSLSEDEVMELSKESIERFSSQPFPKAMAYARNLVKSYPNCELLKIRLAGNHMYLVLRVKEEEQIEEYRSFALSLVESLFRSPDATMQHNARILASSLLSMDDKAEEALAILQPIPKLNDITIMEASLCHRLKKDQEALEQLERFVYTYVQHICMALVSILQIKQEHSHNEQELEQIVTLLENIQHDFRLDLNVGSQIFTLYAKQQNKERTLHYLEGYVEHVLQFDHMRDRVSESLTNSPWFADIPQTSKTFPEHPKDAMKQAIYQSFQEMPCLAFLQEDETFQQLLQRLQS